MLHLPSTTPNYMLFLETGMNSLFSSTLKLHFCYINKVLNMNPQRLPWILAEAVLLKNVFWAKEWTDICQKVNFPPNSSSPLCTEWMKILDLVIIKEREEYTLNAISSQHHDMYPLLNYNVIPVLAENFSAHITCLLIKARGGLLDLNGRSFTNNTTTLCTICNINEDETTYHFLGVCPIYNDIRRRSFGKSHLCVNEVLTILNGKNLYSLYKYLVQSSKYRKLIINEYN